MCYLIAIASCKRDHAIVQALFFFLSLSNTIFGFGASPLQVATTAPTVAWWDRPLPSTLGPGLCYRCALDLCACKVCADSREVSRKQFPLAHLTGGKSYWHKPPAPSSIDGRRQKHHASSSSGRPPPSSVARWPRPRTPPPPACRGTPGTPCRWRGSRPTWRRQRGSAPGWSWAAATW